ncbi:MAG TPA: CDF family Co(II)/Ni(II) efflux transporter DmeF [Gammaproteobacteria bacterium]
MDGHDRQPWEHSHSFGQDLKRPGESRTLLVIAITAVMMVVEVAAGIAFGSMALLADGLHMASHAVALSINAFAYVYARRHAHDARFSFGTGKVNTLGGYTGAVLLAGFALVMVWESVARLIVPRPIAFNEAIFVAVLGLLVNGASVFILREHHHPRGATDIGSDLEEHTHYHDPNYHHHDHNLVSAYLHVLADALTSLLAIFALLAAKYFGLVWADPAMGIVGAVLVGRWSIGLLHSTSVVLLDREGPDDLRELIRHRIEASDDNRVTDLHFWAVGPQMYSGIVSVVTSRPREPDHYKRLLPEGLGVVHLAVEVFVAAEVRDAASRRGPVL